MQNLFFKYPFLKFIWNRYFWISLFFIVWILFLDNYSYLEHRVLNKEIENLESNKEYYKNEIASDSIKIKKLQNLNMIEKYAREKYFMKRDSEDIYIIEFEDDLKNDESKSDL
ncbi:MAG TPA: septum formation initiator [Flavobacterium sp.]|nr:septum formation initiator [Flavobacterium sp.]